MSFLHLYAAQSGSGAYLSQPALTGRFLISSHCQLEHLRRLLPRWPEMCGRLRWKDVERRRKGWREWKGQGWKKDSDEGEDRDTGQVHDADITNCSSLFFSLIFHTFSTSRGEPDPMNCWEIKERVSIENTPHWSWKSWQLERWIPDKDSQGIYRFYSLINSRWWCSV